MPSCQNVREDVRDRCTNFQICLTLSVPLCTYRRDRDRRWRWDQTEPVLLRYNVKTQVLVSAILLPAHVYIVRIHSSATQPRAKW